MIITCIKGGVLPDFNKSIPFGEHDLAMYISEDAYFVFYDIFDCKSQCRFSISSFLDIDKDMKMNNEEVAFRLDYFKKHKKALVNKALRNPDETIFFNSIEAEVISKCFHESKLSCKVDVFVNDINVSLDQIEESDTDLYNMVMEFVEFFDMCEYLNVKEFNKLKKGINVDSVDKKKITLAALAGASLGVVAGLVLGYKFIPKKTNSIEQNSIGEEA